jgi:hypothetical protein
VSKGIASRAKDSRINGLEYDVEDYSEVDDFSWDVKVFAKQSKNREVDYCSLWR